MIESLNNNSSAIVDNTAKLLTLPIPDENFNLFQKMISVWDKNDNDRRNISHLIIFLIHRFPEKMAANQLISSYIIKYINIITQRIYSDRFEIFMGEYVDGFLERRYGAVEEELVKFLRIIGQSYTHEYYATSILFNKYEDKNQRFEILEMLNNHQVIPILTTFKQQMLNAYSVIANNNKVQNDLLGLVEIPETEDIAAVDTPEEEK